MELRFCLRLHCECSFGLEVLVLEVLKRVFPPRRDVWDTSGCPNAHPEGRNGVEHSEALRRVVRAGSRGTIGLQRGKLNEISQLDVTELQSTPIMIGFEDAPDVLLETRHTQAVVLI